MVSCLLINKPTPAIDYEVPPEFDISFLVSFLIQLAKTATCYLLFVQFFFLLTRQTTKSLGQTLSEVKMEMLKTRILPLVTFRNLFMLSARGRKSCSWSSLIRAVFTVLDIHYFSMILYAFFIKSTADMTSTINTLHSWTPTNRICDRVNQKTMEF